MERRATWVALLSKRLENAKKSRNRVIDEEVELHFYNLMDRDQLKDILNELAKTQL